MCRYILIHTRRLAAYCNSYIMEIAKPIMEHSAELFEDAAIVMLVNKWFEEDCQYRHGRTSYLVQWSEYDPNDELSFKPFDSYQWHKDKRNNYGAALDALLIR